MLAEYLAIVRGNPWLFVPFLLIACIIGIYVAEAVHKVWKRQ
jgi:hypothetical protein